MNLAIPEQDNRPTKIVWAPQQGPQTILINCDIPEVFFGGARGGGKTAGLIGKYGIKASSSKYFNGVIFRKELPQADDLVEEAQEVYCKLGAIWKDQKKEFVFPNSSRLRIRPLESEKDAEKYQGQNLTDAGFEEAGNYETSKPIDKIFGALRSKHGNPIQMLLTGNPGGPGQGWIKRRYIDPSPLGLKIIRVKLPNGQHHKRIYIPSRVQDNQILLMRDPSYISRLHLVGSAQLVRAWLEGDFDAIEGQFFDTLSSQRHMIPNMPIPQHWQRYIGFDWGYHSPFSLTFTALSDGKLESGAEATTPDGHFISKGCAVVYKRITGKQLDNADIAKTLIEFWGKKEKLPRIDCDPSIFGHQGGESVADQLSKAIQQLAGYTPHLNPADNSRISGAVQVRQRLNASPPLLMFTEDARPIFNCLQNLPIAPNNSEDVDTKADDHDYDSLRYALMECKLQQVPKSTIPVYNDSGINLQQYVKNYKDQARRAKRI